MTKQSVTSKRVLRADRPLWVDTPHISVVTQKSPRKRAYDVIIVGAGISGALMADALADGKRSILVVDRRGAVKGSSLASTAMIQHEIDTPLFKLSQAIGNSRAERVWRRSAQAVEGLTKLVKSLGISCQLEAKNTLYLAGKAYGPRALRRETKARTNAGINAKYLDAGELQQTFGIERPAAIISSISASANPAQMAAGLLRHARKRGCEIVTPLEITDLTAGGEVVLATSSGHLLLAKHVIFCTGYEFLKPLAHKRHRIISTWAIASKPGLKLPPWLSEALVWEGADPYLYFRTTSDGRLIAGGEDEESADAYLSESKLKTKARIIAEKVGDLLDCRVGAPDYAWSADFGSTPTGLPIIGEVPGLKNVYTVMGYGGNGFTFSKIAAEIIPAMINQKPDPDTELFQ
ncbi:MULTISPECIES: FAD-dependent oxidoreductase [unclassified Chelatococcus]|uniref:NAD(P)/FAD-dependent oxidoreductase n=1 Tax=unclassified Chelatococcus TaxID=2638111 RepID=UPI001BCBE3A5|nr:FAD-dependent oxidoreductase [Chelatococcus sp.]MBS7700810.1 FAD-binding oxidoreductase [Chelatococcus sp. YT9]MBX3559668.1 FAD-binding oxidoreductase [Chelatococcus sp.]